MLAGKYIGVAAKLRFGLFCRDMFCVDARLDQSAKLFMAGVQIIRIDKVIDLLRFIILDGHGLAIAGVEVFTLLFRDFGRHASIVTYPGARTTAG